MESAIVHAFSPANYIVFLSPPVPSRPVCFSSRILHDRKCANAGPDENHHVLKTGLFLVYLRVVKLIELSLLKRRRVS